MPTPIARNRIILRARTREEFIEIFVLLGQGFDKDAFLASNDAPVILVNGAYHSGKSLAVEAMIRAIVDDGNIADLLRNPAKKMFLEQHPTEALYGVSGIFNVAGSPVRFYFGHGRLHAPDLRRAIRLTGQENGLSGAGLFFTSGVYEAEDYPGTWLSSEITIPDDFSTLWDRHIAVEIYRPSLLASPRFVENLKHLTAAYSADRKGAAPFRHRLVL